MVPLLTVGATHEDADFGFESITVDVALDVTLNTPGPARQTGTISFTVTITNLDGAQLTSLPASVVFGSAYLRLYNG